MTDSAHSATHVTLLRHGSCEGGEIYRGSTDVALNSAGWQQMERAVASAENWDCLVSSPLQRCLAFARQMAQSLDVPLQVENDLREMHFGEWEGQKVETVWREQFELCSAFYADPESVSPPGGEAMSSVAARTRAVWRRLIEQQRGQSLLVVAHGAVIRVLISELLCMPLAAVTRLEIPYGGSVRLSVYHSEAGDLPVLRSMNAQGQERVR